MTPEMQKRTDELTDEQFCEMLMEHGSEEDGTAEVNGLKDALATYRTETLDWAERRSAAQPSLAAAAGRRSLWGTAPQWALAAVAVMTVTVGVMHFVGNDTEETASTAEVTTQLAPQPTRQQQIAEDNELLESIDSALNTGSGLPVDSLGLEHVPDMGHHGSAE